MESLFPQEDAARTRTQEAARRHRAGLRAAVRQLMRSPQGRDLLRRLLDVCGAFNAEYTPESAVVGLPEPEEKLEMCQAIESTGALQAFGAFADGALAGFVTVPAPVLPHYGIAIAITESLFVAAHRRTGAGLLLIRTAERHAKEMGSPGLLVSAPYRGRPATLLPRIGYAETNRVFLKRIPHA